MERYRVQLIEVNLKKVHMLSILDCYYRLFPLKYLGFDSEEKKLCKDPVRNEEFWLLRLSPETLLRVMNAVNL